MYKEPMLALVAGDRDQKFIQDTPTYIITYLTATSYQTTLRYEYYVHIQGTLRYSDKFLNV